MLAYFSWSAKAQQSKRKGDTTQVSPARSHTRNVPSSDAEAAQPRIGDALTRSTVPLWPRSVAASGKLKSPSSSSTTVHTRTQPSLPPVTSTSHTLFLACSPSPSTLSTVAKQQLRTPGSVSWWSALNSASLRNLSPETGSGARLLTYSLFLLEEEGAVAAGLT